MNILYAGDLGAGATCLMQIRALGDLRHQVHGVDTRAVTAGPWEARTAHKAWHRLVGTIDLAGAGRTILKKMRSAHFDLIWLYKAFTIPAVTLRTAQSLQPHYQIVG